MPGSPGVLLPGDLAPISLSDCRCIAMSSGHHISMEHRLRRKQLYSDTNASNKTYSKEIQEKKDETFFFRKNEK